MLVALRAAMSMVTLVVPMVPAFDVEPYARTVRTNLGTRRQRK